MQLSISEIFQSCNNHVKLQLRSLGVILAYFEVTNKLFRKKNNKLSNPIKLKTNRDEDPFKKRLLFTNTVI